MWCLNIYGWINVYTNVSHFWVYFGAHNDSVVPVPGHTIVECNLDRYSKILLHLRMSIHIYIFFCFWVCLVLLLLQMNFWDFKGIVNGWYILNEICPYHEMEFPTCLGFMRSAQAIQPITTKNVSQLSCCLVIRTKASCPKYDQSCEFIGCV